MEKIINKAFYFSRTEYAMLIALAGMDSIAGFDPGTSDDQTYSMETDVKALHSLLQREMVSMPEEGVLVLTEQGRQLANNILRASYCLDLESGAKEQHQCLFYIHKDQTTVVENEGYTELGGLKLEIIPTDELFERISESLEEIEMELPETDEEALRVLELNDASMVEYERLCSGVERASEFGSLEEALTTLSSREMLAELRILYADSAFEIGRLIMIRGLLNDWIVTDVRAMQEEITVRPDNQCIRQETLDFLRG